MLGELIKALEAEIAYYKTQHRTVGCKVTHLFGVPLLAVSLPLFVINFRLAARMCILGLILQVAGHYLFEKNKPALVSEGGNPLVLLAALIVVGGNWARVLRGDPLAELSVAVLPGIEPYKD